jgi:protein dithiol oxidoreductase (disulfide-forming)
MIRHFAALIALLSLMAASAARAAPSWTEGRQYFRVDSARHTSVPPGVVEVLEVFSYGCPACNLFNPVARQLAAGLPKNAKYVYSPASFNAAEDWPMFQRAYLTAQVLGIADKTHDAMFAAIWKTGELAVSDPATHRLKNPLPSIEDAARFYNRQTGVAVDKFVATAKSFTVDVKMKAADELALAYHVDSTPTLIVNGKYRLTPDSAGGYNEVVELVKYLVAKESAAH